MQQVAPEIERLAATLSYGQHKEKCPMCIDQRSRNKHDKSLSIKIDSKGVQYQCHHCDISGGIFNDNEWSLDATPLVRQPISRPKVTTNKVAIKYLKTRNISDDVIESHTIPGEYRFNGKTVPAVGFPYRDGNDINAIKWRSADTEKRFSPVSYTHLTLPTKA